MTSGSSLTRWALSAGAVGHLTNVHLEERLFVRINDAPDWQWLRVPQQLGTPWALVGTSVILALSGRPNRGLAALVTLPAEKAAEVLLKKLFRRPRPIYRVLTELRDDAPVEGPSMPSGHVAIATATTWLLAREGPWWLAVMLGSATVATAFTRVHQGAHWPTDTVAGAALGLTLAVTATAVCERVSRIE